MYVSIDMAGLRALHIHPVPGVVHDLVYLECAALEHVKVENTSSDLFLADLTDMELKMLFRNLTGEETNWSPLAIRHTLAINLAGLTPVKVNQSELSEQCEYAGPLVSEGRTTFKYAYGAKRPAEMQELFPLKLSPLGAWHNGDQIGTQRIYTPPAATVPTAATPGAARPPAGPRAPSGSTRPKIWSVADAMWEAAGKPTDKTVVLALRKEMMTALETDHNIKRTTSSTALGDWMKERVP